MQGAEREMPATSFPTNWDRAERQRQATVPTLRSIAFRYRATVVVGWCLRQNRKSFRISKGNWRKNCVRMARLR